MKGNVADLIVSQLYVWGVQRVYGVIGDAIFGLLNALGKQGNIQFVAVKHESTAALMASAEAKLTGKIGVCISQMGPGLGNLLNGLADAFFDMAPVLAITGQAPLNKIGTDYKQYVNQQELVKPLARFSTLITHPDTVPEILAKALEISLREGTVTHVSVPADLFDVATGAKPYQRPTILAHNSGFYDFERATKLMCSAQKPMIVIGAGARSAEREIEQLAESWGAGVITSLNGTGIVPNNFNYMLGGIGEGGNPFLPGLFTQSDIVLIIGTTWWPEGYVPKSARILQIDKRQSNLGKGFPIEIGMVGDAKEILPLMFDEVQVQRNMDWIRQIQEVKKSWGEQCRQEGTQSGAPLHPARIIQAIEKTIDHDAIVALDYGDSTLWFYRCFRADRQSVLVSEHWRTMGFGLPAAIAAKLCAPKRQVIAVVGDGGIEMTLADLLTGTRYKTGLTVVLFNNGTLQMERDKMMKSGYHQIGSDLTNPDFVL